MIRTLLKFRVIQILGLIAILPLLIGHGLGCLDCPAYEPEIYDFVLSGSIDPESDISIGHSLHIWAADNAAYTSPAGAAGRSIPPVFFSEINYFGMEIVANAPNPDGNTIGEMWVHESGKHLKLLHPAASPSYMNVHFGFFYSHFDEPQSSMIASSSMYTLAGGRTGSESLNLGAHVEIYLNNVNIFTRTEADNNIVSPIMFSADPGANLRIVANIPGYISSIWLFTPAGVGIKLFEESYNGQDNNSGAFIDVLYVLE